MIEENEVESDSFQVEQSHVNSDLGQINSLEIAVVSGDAPKHEESSFLSGVEALRMQNSEENLDIRPYLYDSNTKSHILWDSGSQVTAWPPDAGDKADPSMSLRAVNGSKLRCYGFKEVSVRVNRKSYPIKAIKTDVSSPVLGFNFTKKHRLDTRWTEWGDVVMYDPKAKIQSVLKYKALEPGQVHKLSVINSSSEAKPSHQYAAQVAAVEALGVEDDNYVVVNDLEKLPDGPYKELLRKYPDLLKMSFEGEDPKHGVIHRISTIDEEPIRAKVRRYPPGSPKAVEGKKAIKELERLGILERVDPSKPNNWVSPLHFAVKPDGSLRPVGDFKVLNRKTVLDLFPLPNLRSFTQDIAGSRVFSKVDMTKAFHQIVIDKRDRHKCCITTPWGLFQFRRLAMGMQNSAQSFQRMVQDVLRDMPNVFVYLDDILVYSKTKKEHLETLEELFNRLNAAGLTLALDKCRFGVEKLSYLGYEVSASGISPIPKKVDAIQNFPVPVKQKQLLGFLGALNYYRASLPSLPPDKVHKKPRTPAQVLDPLYKLATCELPRKTKFEDVWNASQNVQQAFQDAKVLLQNAVTLNFPDPSAPLALTTDASKIALGATLDQFIGGAWRPLGMWSKMLKPQQQNYSTYRRELMSIQLAMRHFNEDFNGRHLIIFSDHRPLVGSFSNNDLQSHDPLAQNAINEIAQFTSDLRFKSGKSIPIADWLSRPAQSSNKGKDALSSSHQAAPDRIPLSSDIKYVSPEETLAALEAVALQTLSPSKIAGAQAVDRQVQSHVKGDHPAGVKVASVKLDGVDLVCEVSDGDNPRPMIPESLRSLVLNLFHHTDHAGQKETLRRTASEYYWPKLKNDVTWFVKSCHPCQLAKQARPVDPGIGDFPVPDRRFQFIHLDIVGPLPESFGHKYLLTIYDRCSRWIEAFALRRDTAEEVSDAFLQYISRFGLPSVACSDNGNAFISNLFQDILKNFGVEVRFTPAYHAATNGAIERKHQDLKNALKAVLVQMGNDHRDQWFRALPWVLLGQRVRFQPNLDASSAQLVLQMSPRIPGQLLGDPGPPLTNVQTRALLDQLYKLADKPPVPTSGRRVFNDISETENATHVYIKVDTPLSLYPKWEGPYRILSRPSRSRIEVKLGMFRNGSIRKAIYHWNTCKVAYLRDSQPDASRPKLGRPPKQPQVEPPPGFLSSPSSEDTSSNTEDVYFQYAGLPPAAPTSRVSAPNSNDTSFTDDYEDEVSSAGDYEVNNDAAVPPSRPVRSTRNPRPVYK